MNEYICTPANKACNLAGLEWNECKMKHEKNEYDDNKALMINCTCRIYQQELERTWVKEQTLVVQIYFMFALLLPAV